MNGKLTNSNFFQEYAATRDFIKSDRNTISYYPQFKRIIDIFLSLIGFIICLPVIILFAILIKLESPGPAFFSQERVGKDGKYFNILKLRSMSVNAEKNGAQWATKNDPRVTKIGKFIRMTRIDELPQLLNVLKGEMSIIGPRPERPHFTAQFNEEIPGFTNRLSVLPGLTGWAQVNGGYDISPKEKLEHDLYYIQRVSFKIDVLILVKTVRVIFTGDGAR